MHTIKYLSCKKTKTNQSCSSSQKINCFKMPNNNNRHLNWYLERSIFSAKALYGERKVFLLLLYLNEQAMTFAAYRFHRHWSLTLKCVLRLINDTNSATMIPNYFIPPIKLKHCLRKYVSFLSNFVSTVGFVSCSNEHQVNSNN